MSRPFIIDPGLSATLAKINFTQGDMKQLNDSYAESIRSGPSPPKGLSLPVDRADAVARWSVNFAIGVEFLPVDSSIIFTLQDFQTIDGDYPRTDRFSAEEAGFLSRAPETDAVKSLMARVFAAVPEREGIPDNHNHNRLQALPNYFKQYFDFKFATKNLLNDIGPLPTGPTPEWNSLNPDWKLRPATYVFHTGFPRTLAERQFSFQIMYLLYAFAARTASHSKTLTERIHEDAKAWHLPDTKDVNWQDAATRTKYFADAEQATKNALSAIRQRLFTSLNKFIQIEVFAFLTACRQHVAAADPNIFEDYWTGQLQGIMYSSLRAFDVFLANQRFILALFRENLRTSNDVAKSKILAKRMIERENDNFADLLGIQRFWEVAGLEKGVLLQFMVYMGGEVEGYPSTEAEGEMSGFPGYGEVVFKER